MNLTSALERRFSVSLGTIDYCIEKDVVLRITPEKVREERVLGRYQRRFSQEAQKIVLQIGTNNAESAAEIAEKV